MWQHRFEATGSALYAPEIEELSLILDNQLPAYLKIQGQHFMLDPQQNQVLLDGVPLALSATQILQNGKAKTWASLQNTPNFDRDAQHQLLFRTPLGQTLYFFEGL